MNGTSGIAVGMATNIPPHNLREVVDAVVKIIDNIIEEQRETTMEEILDIVKGPDFPTGATILGRRGIEEAYRTGRGKIRVRAVTNIETLPNGKSRIIVTELPYLVNKARLISKIAELVRDKKIDGITDLNDHSSREGMRICIDLRKDANANVVLNLLYKHTQLQDTFGVNMLSLIPNNGSLEPKVLNLKQMLEYYLAHQEDVVTRRTKYDLNKARERAHILEGLLKALDNIDEVIRIIRASQNVQIAKQELMDRFELTDVQAQAIVDMRLRALTGLEREKLEAEYADLMEKIRKYMDNRSVENTRKLLTEELDVIHQQIQELNRLQKNVEERLLTLSGAEDQALLKIRLQTFPDRYCHTLHIPYHTDEEMDLLVKQLLNKNTENLYIISNHNIGSFLPLEEIKKGQYENYSGVFIIDNSGEYCLRGGTYLTFTYAGDYRQNTTYIPELLNYADGHGLVPDGPILELIWVDNHQSADIREHITELQLRIYSRF